MTDTKSYRDLEKFESGRLCIFRLPLGKTKKQNYQGRFLIPGETSYVHRSLKTEDRDKAYRAAYEIYDDLRLRAKAGESLKSKKISKAIDEYLDFSKNRSRFESTERTIGKYFRSYVQGKDFSFINPITMQGYEIWRSENALKPGNIPSNSTLNHDVKEIKKFLKFCVDAGYLKASPDFKTPSFESQTRPAFDRRDYKKLTSNAWRWIKESKHPSTERDRKMLWSYVLVLLNTGIRVGEARSLRWMDLKAQKSQIKPDETDLILSVKGKTNQIKPREVVASNADVKEWFRRILELRRDELKTDPNPDSFIFCHPDGRPIGSFKKSFRSLITRAGVEFDNWGNRHTLYSLRHTYATMALQRVPPVDAYVLAKNMGTSVEMIRLHYDYTTNPQNAAELTRGRGNVARRRSNKEPERGFFGFLD